MKKTFLVVMLFIATSFRLFADENSAIFVLQYNGVSTYVISWSEENRYWGVYRLNSDPGFCPVQCYYEELLYSNDSKDLCMEWGLTDLGYAESGFARYWGEYRGEETFYVINNYSYDYVSNYEKENLWCPTNCMNNRTAGNQVLLDITLTLNTNQVIHAEIPANENINISIYDYSGKLVYVNSIQNSNSEISVEKTIMPGIYLIKFSSNTESKTLKATIY